jgi:uncharacterized OsmC-like protein
MSKHTFNLRLTASYETSENKIGAMDVQVLSENGWEALDLNTLTPGFLIYVYSMFTCQHLYLRTNATERELVLASSQGEIRVEASKDWLLEKVEVKFSVNLSSGEASKDNVDYIISRMKQCPVSKNLPRNIEIHTKVDFHNV